MKHETIVEVPPNGSLMVYGTRSNTPTERKANNTA